MFDIKVTIDLSDRTIEALGKLTSGVVMPMTLETTSADVADIEDTNSADDVEAKKLAAALKAGKAAKAKAAREDKKAKADAIAAAEAEALAEAAGDDDGGEIEDDDPDSEADTDGDDDAVEPQYDLEALLAGLRTYADLNGKPAAVKVLKKFKVAKLSLMKPEDYDALGAELGLDDIPL